MSTQRDIALGMVVTTWASARVKAGVDAQRESGKADLFSRETIAAVNPLTGEALGFITRTNPTPVAEVSDLSALMAHVGDTDPDQLVDVDYLVGSTPDIIAALKKSHPELVAQRPEITAHHLKYLLATAEKDKTFRPPGITVTKPVGTVNAYPDKDIPDEVFLEVIKSGAVALDGTIRPALEGASE